MVKSDFGFVVIQLSRKLWEGNVKLYAEEIGLDASKIPDNVYLGHKKLYPKRWRDEFNKAYMKAFHEVDKVSLPFIGNSLRAISKERLENLEAKLEEHRVAYLEVRDRFKYHYERTQEEMKASTTPELWSDMKDYYPPVDMLDEKFDLTWNVFNVSTIEASPVSSQEVRTAVNRARNELNNRLARWSEEVVRLTRGKALESLRNLNNRLADGKIVRNETLDNVRNMVDWFKDLNFFDDKSMTEALRVVENSLTGINVQDIKDDEALRNEIVEATGKAIDIAASFQDVDILTANYKRTLEV